MLWERRMLPPHVRSGFPVVRAGKLPVRTLVQEHVGIAEEPAHQFRGLRGIRAGQLLLRLGQEVAQLRAGADLRNAVALLIVTCSGRAALGIDVDS